MPQEKNRTESTLRAFTQPLALKFVILLEVVSILSDMTYEGARSTGYLTDQTKRYCTITLVGYALNLFAVPLLALAGRWEIATALCDQAVKMNFSVSVQY